MLQHHIPILIFTKILFASFTLYILSVWFGDMFSYPDFYSIYSSCTEKPYTNILFSEFFCSLSSITGKDLTHRSIPIILSASLLNLAILIGYFKICAKYLNDHGKYFLILLFILHPYMNIYFFRFYTDLFASLGLFLIFLYKVKNININFFFVASALILMNFRNALIPVFFIYGLLEICLLYSKNKSITLSFPLLLIVMSLASYSLVMEFGMQFTNINSNIDIFERIITNIILLLGYRESIGISRDMPAFNTLANLLSIILIIIHVMGIYGIIQFSRKIHKSILIIFIYILLPILAISHMRYLLPLMPILMFGLSYLFFKNDQAKGTN
jgi:hypothetical protein